MIMMAISMLSSKAGSERIVINDTQALKNIIVGKVSTKINHSPKKIGIFALKIVLTWKIVKSVTIHTTTNRKIFIFFPLF